MKSCEERLKNENELLEKENKLLEKENKLLKDLINCLEIENETLNNILIILKRS